MTARPFSPECRRWPLIAAVGLVLLAMAMAAGCIGSKLCGGKFDVYELADSQKPGDNVVHLTEQDFKENPELDEVLRGVKQSNANCAVDYYKSGRCIGGSWYKCGGKVRLIKYDATNKTPNFNDDRILEYNGKYYFLIFTIVS